MAEVKKVFTARTIEEAKAMAAKEFGTEESRIAFNVIEEPKKGIFGKVKGDARVEAVYEQSKGDIAAAYIRTILKCMGAESEVSVSESEEGAAIEIVGDTTGAVIGRRGETLDAIQYLASMAANKGDKDYCRITVDCCGYREKRKATLEELAVKISKTVLRTGRTSALEPMNPYERRIIHSTVAGIDGVISKSVGEEPFRKVIISPANPRPRNSYNRDGGYNREGGYNRDGYNRDYNGGYRNKPRRDKRPEDYKPVNMMKTSFEKDYKRPKPEDDLVEGDLYGKIDI